RGLFRFRGGTVAKIGDETTSRVRRTPDGTVLVLSRHGLLRLDGDPAGRDQPAARHRLDRLDAKSQRPHAGVRGLFWLTGGELERIEGGERVGDMQHGGAVHSIPDGTLLVGTEKGLFRLARCP